MSKKHRFLVLSDIHANIEALEAVLHAVKRRRYHAVLCMGDLVGYGARPNQVVNRVRRFPNLHIVRGNHDRVCCGLESPHNFNAAAKASASWTLDRLSEDNRRYLTELPKGPLDTGLGAWICHGSVTDEDLYMFSDFDAYQAFEAVSFRICFFGHTHLPYLYRQSPKGIDMVHLQGNAIEMRLDPVSRYLINPGSVGQPRDRNPLASFAEFTPETGRLLLRRIPYDLDKTQKCILKAGLPENLAHRLSLGA